MFKKLLKYRKKRSVKEKESPVKEKKVSKTNLKEVKEKKPAAKKEAAFQYPANKILTAEGWLRRRKKSI